MTDLTDMSGDNPPDTWVKEAARQEHQALMASNQQAMRAIIAAGGDLDAGTMLKMRVDYLTQYVLSHGDEEGAFTFAIGWEKFLGAILDEAAQQARIASLTLSGGIPVMPGQLEIPGA